MASRGSETSGWRRSCRTWAASRKLRPRACAQAALEPENTLRSRKPASRQSRKGKPAGESGELYIGDSRIALLEAAGNRHSGNAAHAGGTAEFFFFDGGYDGGVIH